MTATRRPSRRAVLMGAALGLLAATTPAAAKKRVKKSGNGLQDVTSAVTGTPLTWPRLIELADRQVFDLSAEPATHAFVKDKPVAVAGYGGTYMGPALKLRRGTRVGIRLVNKLDRPTNIHWHGLLVPGRADGGTRPGIEPGASWQADLTVDQPAATLWYHAHVHGRTAQDVHDGLAGLLIVEDDDSRRLALPSTWGVDDLAMVLQDRIFDAAGRPQYAKTAEVMDHGFHGPTMIVNGIADAMTKVPQRPVRLRLLNAGSARTFRLFFEDQRPFRLIATDGGFLSEPAELTFLALAPGERAEIVVDFAEGSTNLLTGPDEHEHRAGAQVTILPDVIDQPARVVAFEAIRDSAPRSALPAVLATLAPPPKSTSGFKRRRFELRMQPGLAAVAGMAAGHDHASMAMTQGSMSHGPVGHDGEMEAPEAPSLRMTINGKAFAMGRIDETVKLGSTEVWEVVCPEMAHPFHIHGAQFRVLSEDGDKPKLWNRGVKDTVLVENSAELLVTFDRAADASAPFVYHCHLLEHEDGGMMGTFTVG